MNKLDATFWLSLTKATLLLINKKRLSDLFPIRRALDHNFTVFIDFVCSANSTIEKKQKEI